MNATAGRPPQSYRCRVYGIDDLSRARPEIARACPACQRRLPTTRGLLSLETRR